MKIVDELVLFRTFFSLLYSKGKDDYQTTDLSVYVCVCPP
jgi:hypothetical protein